MGTGSCAAKREDERGHHVDRGRRASPEYDVVTCLVVAGDVATHPSAMHKVNWIHRHTPCLAWLDMVELGVPALVVTFVDAVRSRSARLQLLGITVTACFR